MGTIWVSGKQVEVDPSNWQVVAKSAIDDAIYKSPGLGNATQLAIMNAVKTAAGVFDSASPFESRGDMEVAAKLQTSPILDVPILGEAISDVADWIQHTGARLETMQNGAADFIVKASKATGAGLDDFTEEIKTVVLVGGVLAGIFLVLYAVKIVKG